MKNTHFLLGIDSDGTAFDSMSKKHEDAFIPAALQIWPLQKEAAKQFSEIERDINLYSELRGVNRFPGLFMTMERLSRKYPSLFPNLQDFRGYIQKETNYSQKSLNQWEKKHPSSFLRQVLTWSDQADRLFEKACEDITPFDGVREALQMVFPHACIAVISSASKNSLCRDWTANGLTPYVDVLMSQEDGSKQEQLRKAAAFCSAPVHSLMVGDTKMDQKAAADTGSSFFLISPGKECESWKELIEHVLPAFLRQ